MSARINLRAEVPSTETVNTWCFGVSGRRAHGKLVSGERTSRSPGF
jgi:hypothetical protein